MRPRDVQVFSKSEQELSCKPTNALRVAQPHVYMIAAQLSLLYGDSALQQVTCRGRISIGRINCGSLGGSVGDGSTVEAGSGERDECA